MNEQIKNGRPRIYFTGVGGQGTLTATRLLGEAALAAGIAVVAGEVHGMAQRGGVVESSLSLGGWRSARLDYGEADIILGFEPLETLRGLPYLAAGGVVFSSLDRLPPPGVSLGGEKYPDMEQLEKTVRETAARSWFLHCRALGEAAGAAQSGGTALLGALCASGCVPFDLEFLLKAIHDHLPPKLRESNTKAARLGAEAVEGA